MSRIDKTDPISPKTNFFIAGFEKCGTTSLHKALSQHTKICMSFTKEPQFFEREYWQGLPLYRRKYFHHYAGEDACGEARPHNAVIGYVPERIKEVMPNAKMIFLVRNPIERAYSGWQHWRNMRPGREPFEFDLAIDANTDNEFTPETMFMHERDWCNNLDPAGGSYERLYMEHGRYMDHIKRFMKHFDCIVIPYEILIREPNNSISAILEFLRLPYEDLPFPHLNIGRESKRAYELHRDFPHVTNFLRRYYKESNEELINTFGFTRMFAQYKINYSE